MLYHPAPSIPPGDPVPGGFWMSADNVKYTAPMATSLSLLAWSVVEFRDGYKAQVGSAI